MLNNTSALGRITAGVLALWPEHQKYIDKSMAQRSSDVMKMTLQAADLIERIIGDDFDRFTSGYRWVCDMVLAEELIFRRTGAYRYSKFVDTNREVYQNKGLMEKYMDGVLLSQIFWANHAAMLAFYKNNLLGKNKEGYRHLEIGPGHGLLLYEAAVDPRCSSASGWDVSPTSLDHTQKCWHRLGPGQDVALTLRNIAEPGAEGLFDSITISEVLEHVENPEYILGVLKGLLALQGRIYVNVPINSPAIDHIFLWRRPEDAVDLVRSVGLEIVDTCFAPATGYTEKRARRLAATISCGIVATRK